MSIFGNTPRSAHSHGPRPRDTGITHLWTYVGRRGTHTEGGIKKIGPLGGQFPSGHDKKVLYHGLVHPYTHDF